MAILKNMNMFKNMLIVFLLIQVPKKILGQMRLDNVDSLPLTADGWRPILSNRPQQEYKIYQDIYSDSSNIQVHTPATVKHNNQYNSTSKIVAKPSETSSPAPQINNTQNYQTHGQKQQHKTRLNPHNSNIISPMNLGKIFGNNQDIILHGNHPNTRNHGNILSHGYKIHGNMSPYLHTFGSSSSYRHPVMGKLQAHMVSAGKRYKHPTHLGSATTRDEVFLSPPSGILGSYPFFHSPSSKGISTIHHGSTGGKHYIFPGALPTHIEFPNHYSPLPNVNDELIQQLMRDSNPSLPNQFAYSKHNLQNEFNRNLLPPPFKPLFEAENSKTRTENLNQKVENIGQSSQTIHDPQIVVGKQKNGEKTKKPSQNDRNIVPENLIVQLPPPHHSGHSQDTKNVELEITKEKFNVYHDHIPSNYNSHPQVQNFFSSDAKVTPSKSKYSPHTYEVTEGKYEESTQPNFPQKAVSNRYFNQIPSSLQEHEGFTFLPTPYRPLKVNPTLSTHDVSTLYTSYNQNKVKPHDLFTPTQYPIYKEQNQYQYNHQYNDLSTQLSVPSKESQRINYAQNEITTLSEYEVPPLPTVHPSSYYYTINQEIGTSPSTVTERATKRPKVTTTTTTTTTTTETPVKTTRSYVRNRSQTRRRRPTSKPTTSYKDLTTTPTYENRVTTPTYDSYESISDVTIKNYQQTNRPKLPKPYRTSTTQAPEPEVLTTSLQPAVEPTLPIQNKYQIIEEQNDGSEKYLSQKHRVRPADFMDDFEDSEYHLRSKYQDFDDNKYEKNLKQRPIKDNYQYDEYIHPVSSKYNKKPNRERPTRPSYEELEEYTNYETTKYDYDRPQKNYQTYDLEENIPSQKYIKTTPPTFRDDEPVTDKYEVTKIIENEVDPSLVKETTNSNERIKEVFTTKSPVSFYSTTYEKEVVTYPEPEVTTLPKVVTSETPTTKGNKLRTKSNRYEANRPRFSVKDYRYKLNQQSTSTENSNTETTTSRIRFPTRMRTPQPSVESTNNQNDESRNRNAQKDTNSEDIRKFVPKESRYKSTTENIKTPEVTSTTERTFSTYKSNRTRPNTGKYNYNRYRSTTESGNSATITVPPPKVVIKSNTLLKRPASLSLRTRIMNKQKSQNTSTTTTENTNSINFETIKTDSTEYKIPQQTTLPSSNNDSKKDIKDNEEKFDIEDLFSNQPQKSDTDKDSNTSYSQRVADLTSSLSASKDYNSPGMFKTVSPNTSRRVPNYFTIATDDPILPIEAFFPQLSQKDNQGN